jgi:hypothetical protein
MNIEQMNKEYRMLIGLLPSPSIFLVHLFNIHKSSFTTFQTTFGLPRV